MTGSIEKRGAQHYRIRVHLGYDESGRRRTKSLIVRGTRKEAQLKLAELLREVAAQEVVPPEAMSVEQYIEYFLENYASTLATRTHRNYAEYLRGYVVPALGKIRLSELQPTQIQALYRTLLQSGSKKNGSGLSPTTVHNLNRVFKGSLRQAVRWQMLARNPAENVTPPRPALREQRVLSREEVARILSAARGTRLYVPVLLGVSTGMRRGEICGLRWQDIDLERGVLSIVQTLVNISAQHLEFKTPKTRMGRRAVKLPTLVTLALAEEKARQESIRLHLGSTYNAGNLVVIRDDGTFYHPATLYSLLQQLLARLSIPRRGFHDLRHTHVTALLELGVNPKTVAERVGHADPALTLRVYSHVLDHIQQEAANQTDEYLRATLAPPNDDPSADQPK